MTPSHHPRRIAIVGAGPAGATLGCLLARRGVSVVIFDDGRRPEMVVGESLVPQLVPVFRDLGIEDEVRRFAIRKPGVTITFDDAEEIRLSFEAIRGVLPTYAYNVPRREFDALINRTAREAGVGFMESHALIERGDADRPVKLAAESLAGVPDWAGRQPDFLVDASGRRRLFAKLLGITAAKGRRSDVAHFAHFEDCPWPEPAGQVMTMRMQHGWGWRIPLPGPRLSLGVVLNRDHARAFGTTPEEQLDGLLANEPRLQRECPNRRRVSQVATYSNYQLVSDQGWGRGWAMVGDAFGFVDPMLSPGLCMAMLSARMLADVLLADTGGDRGFEGYEAWFRNSLSAWQELVDVFYDGRIFATFKTGMGWAQRHPGPLTRLINGHIEKNLAGMASGAYTTRPYSRWLLRFLCTHCMSDANPSDYAIR